MLSIPLIEKWGMSKFDFLNEMQHSCVLLTANGKMAEGFVEGEFELPTNHAYRYFGTLSKQKIKILIFSLLDLRKITTKNGEEEKLIRISNPWGYADYSWSKYRKKYQNLFAFQKVHVTSNYCLNIYAHASVLNFKLSDGAKAWENVSEEDKIAMEYYERHSVSKEDLLERNNSDLVMLSFNYEIL